MSDLWSIGLALLLAYLLGSLSGSLILGRMIGVDIRRSGSGNAGGTNAFRTRGWRFALSVALIDVSKGVLAAWIPTLSGLNTTLTPWLMAGCILAAAVGHVWPIFFGFRGGKGAAVLVGGLAVFWPSALVLVLLVWLGVLLLSGYVGLATILASASLLPMAALNVGSETGLRWAFALLATGFILFTHRANVQRLRHGNEHRFNKVRVFARKTTGSSGPK